MGDPSRTDEAVRFDAGRLVGEAEVTPEGWLRVDARLTRTGIFTYRLPDGTVRRELRTPTEVFRPDSLDSLKLRPTSDDHPYAEPRGLLNAENTKKYQVGHTGETIRADGRWVVAPIVVTDAKMIAAIRSKQKPFLSCGYTCQLKPASPGAQFDGEPYDYVQENIRYNHVAHVARPRAGEETRIRLDANDAFQADGHEPDAKVEETKMADPIKLVTVKLDGLDYQCAPEIERALTKQTTEIGELRTKLDAATGKADAQAAEITDLKTKLDAASKVDIAALVQNRVNLLTSARRVVKDEAVKLDEMNDLDIKRAVVKAKHPNANLDGQSEAYIAARFDAVIESLPDEKTEKLSEGRRMIVPRSDSTNNEDKAASARNAYLERLANGWKSAENKQ